MNNTQYSQNGQDLFVLKKLNYKRNGYFVEIGVGDGIHISNTYLLEKDYGWTGILCESNKNKYDSILKKRKCKLLTDPIYSVSNMEVEFSYSSIDDLSGISEYLETSFSRFHKEIVKKEKMRTMSLNDALESENAPKNIDYISVDTEGSELEILSTFSFDKYNVKIWTIEHNEKYRSDGKEYKEKLINFMVPHGYKYEFIENDLCFYKEIKIKVFI